MTILNIAGYQFTPLTDLPDLQENFTSLCSSLGLKGTILLSSEGININLAGLNENIHSFINSLQQDVRFKQMTFHKTSSSVIPFKRLKIKLKKEIITFRQNQINPTKRASCITPELLKQWLDENKDFTLLDTRNAYEIEYGSFEKATHLNLNDFCELPEKYQTLEKQKPIVMFCTGGIRCEKAALFLNNEGYHEVYQLDGGIIGYFQQVGGAHFQGSCFVFDERVAVDPNLNSI